MKILQVSQGAIKIPTDRSAGLEGQIFLMSKHFSKMGHEVIIFDRKYSQLDSDVEVIEGVTITRFPVRQLKTTLLETKFRIVQRLRFLVNKILFWMKVSKYIKTTPVIDAINVYDIFAALLFFICNSPQKDKIFYTHQSSFWPSLKSGNIMQRLVEGILCRITRCLAKRMGGIIVPNYFAYSKFQLTNTRSWFNTYLILPGIEVETFSSSGSTTSVNNKYLLAGKKIILFAGRINPEKGIEYLVKAADIIINKLGNKSVIFLLAGPYGEFVDPSVETVYTRKIRFLIKTYNLEKDILLTGFIPLEELRQLYSICDVFVLPSLMELFGQVISEAMASSKPVIATKTPGALMQIKDGVNGFLVNPADEVQLAQKIKYLLDNPVVAKSMGAHARESVQDLDWRSVSQKYLDIYSNKRKEKLTFPLKTITL